MARFAVTGAFALTGRGFVLAGNIVEGTLRKGMRLRYAREGQHEEFEITGVEFIDHMSKRTAEMGLLLPLQAIRDLKLDDSNWWVGNEYECVTA